MFGESDLMAYMQKKNGAQPHPKRTYNVQCQSLTGVVYLLTMNDVIRNMHKDESLRRFINDILKGIHPSLVAYQLEDTGFL